MVAVGLGLEAKVTGEVAMLAEVMGVGVMVAVEMGVGAMVAVVTGVGVMGEEELVGSVREVVGDEVGTGGAVGVHWGDEGAKEDRGREEQEVVVMGMAGMEAVAEVAEEDKTR